MRLSHPAAALALAGLLATAAAGAANDDQVMETTIADCENRWVVVPYTLASGWLAFAYIDPQHGWTLRFHGDVERREDGTPTARPDLPDYRHADRRMDRKLSATCLAPADVARLRLPATPEWLAAFADTAAPGEHALRWGKHYLDIGAARQALPFLLDAQRRQANPEHTALALAEAYNDLDRWDEAKAVLVPALRQFPGSTLLQVELAETQWLADDKDDAVATYRKLVAQLRANPEPERWKVARNLAALLYDLDREEEGNEATELAATWKRDQDTAPADDAANAAGRAAPAKSAAKGGLERE